MLNPPTQYETDANLRARQRLWQHQQPPFDIVGWVLELAQVDVGQRALDVGCGNGVYLRRLEEGGVVAVGCDLSPGMLRAAAPHRRLVCGDVQRLPIRRSAFDVVLAPHMLYHVEDRAAAASEMRRVLRPGGPCVVITNGREHMRAVRQLVEAAVRRATPGWELRNPSTHIFSLENGGQQLATAFDSVQVVRPEGVAPVSITDASVVAEYVASVADHYQDEVDRPWQEIVREVRLAVEERIAIDDVFTVRGETGAFLCT